MKILDINVCVKLYKFFNFSGSFAQQQRGFDEGD